jgi:hypothetical protein
MPESFRRPRSNAIIAGGVVLALALAACTRPEPERPRPDRLVVMVFDQMRPDYIDRFDLDNFKRLRASSRHYPEAYVGHLASQTIVSHLVIPTGLPPKELPWVEDVLLDAEGALGTPNAVYKTDDLTRDQMWHLLERVPRERFLQSRIQDAHGPVFAIGEKNYAAMVFGGPHASAIVTLAKAKGRCTPDGVNVPAYITGNPRFSLDCAETYGTGLSTIYALDGSRFVPGNDASRPGGDVWTADVALEVMRRESWAGLFLTFGGIDRVAHMLGEQDGPGLASVQSEYRLADILRVADAQLGRILNELDARGLAERTMVVVTADHGGQRHEAYLGNNLFQSCCPYDNVADPPEPPYWLQHLNNVGKLRTGYADSDITLWLADHSEANTRAVIRGLQDVSGVTEIYANQNAGGTYRNERVYDSLERQGTAFRFWAGKHSEELANTMASAAGPDLIALLADGYGFGRIGGHGGAQEKVQRIPMIIRVPGEMPSRRTMALRLMDLAPEIAKVLGFQAN